MKRIVVMSIVGILLNLILVRIVNMLELPLYLDIVGTILAGAIGGPLSGITVGYVSNCITTFSSIATNPMTIYYAVLNALMGLGTALLYKKGNLLKWKGILAAFLMYVFCGGVLGAILTWLLFGFNFGTGISAPFAQFFYNHSQLSEFESQFLADVGINIVDKLITIVLAFPVIYYVQKKYFKVEIEENEKIEKWKPFAKRKSIRIKILFLILSSTILISIAAIIIGGITQKKRLIEQYTTTGEWIANLVESKIDPEQIDRYLTDEISTEEYISIQQELDDIFDVTESITNIYVYRVLPDYYQTVFQTDGDKYQKDVVGKKLEYNNQFSYQKEAAAGEDIPAVVKQNKEKNELTIYEPIRNQQNKVVAYAGVDIDMSAISKDEYSYVTIEASMLLGLLLIIIIYSIWFCNIHLIEPITVLAQQARNFTIDKNKRKKKNWEQYVIETGDELEDVYQALRNTETEIEQNVKEIKNKNKQLSQMQKNIIFTLANMVENRDGSTGGHVKRTAEYVKVIGKQMIKSGIYEEIVDRTYVRNLYDSAPLHDIGKIKIPDNILNKPGKLTKEEFAIIKTHTTVGKEILQHSLTNIEDITWLSMALDMSLYHHEKWDGSGYPEGLSGVQIPLCARIMAVADVFDALVSVRSYKDAISFENAVGIIKEGAGHHFDAKIVEAFLSAKDDILNIFERNK